MRFDGEISHNVLSALYLAAADGEHWQKFCNVLSEQIESPVMFFAHNIGANIGLGIMGGGLAEDQLELYDDFYADKNPWMHMNESMPVGMVGVSDQALRQEQLFKTEFYNDWLRHQENIIGGPAMICDRTGESFAAIALAGRAKRYDDVVNYNTQYLRALAPHMIRAIDLSKTLAEKSVKESALLDSANYGVIHILRSGKTGNINKKAQSLMERSGVLTVNRQEKLGSGLQDVRTMLARAVTAMQNQDFKQLPLPLPVMLPCGRQVALHAHIIPEQMNEAFPISVWMDPPVGIIAITGNDGTNNAAADEKLIQSYGATPAETRVALALLDGKRLYDFADENGISRHTVRNQMRSLLLKTNTRNQTDFVRTISRLSLPFSAFTD